MHKFRSRNKLAPGPVWKTRQESLYHAIWRDHLVSYFLGLLFFIFEINFRDILGFCSKKSQYRGFEIIWDFTFGIFWEKKIANLRDLGNVIPKNSIPKPPLMIRVWSKILFSVSRTAAEFDKVRVGGLCPNASSPCALWRSLVKDVPKLALQGPANLKTNYLLIIAILIFSAPIPIIFYLKSDRKNKRDAYAQGLTRGLP